VNQLALVPSYLFYGVIGMSLALVVRVLRGVLILSIYWLLPLPMPITYHQPFLCNLKLLVTLCSFCLFVHLMHPVLLLLQILAEMKICTGTQNLKWRKQQEGQEGSEACLHTGNYIMTRPEFHLLRNPQSMTFGIIAVYLIEYDG